MDYLLIMVLGILVGIGIFPLLLFVRARRADGWDNSNVFNIYRVVAHLVVRPADFAKMRYEDGSIPFWYIGQDEFSEVVGTSYKGDKE